MTFQNGLSFQTLPQGARNLLAVEHIGPTIALRLYEDLGVDTLEKLWKATQQQRIRQLSGFGPRSEIRIKEAVESVLKRRNRQLNGVA
jgi:DNA polymerase (family 10)